MVKRLAKKALKKIVHTLRPKEKKPSANNEALPKILERPVTTGNYSLSHVSAFHYGNAGDILLPVVLQETWEHVDGRIDWENFPVYPTVDLQLVEKINKTRGLIIGGGGLFLKDTNANDISGWQWPCSIEMLSKIKVPVAFYAVGYNRFRGQDDFEPVFTENIKAFAEKAVYIGLRNTGSINSIKSYLPKSLHHKLRFQPCMTTFISQVYPKKCDFNTKKDFIAVNMAFDRSHLRFGKNIGQILSETAMVIKELSEIMPIRYYSHMPSDEAILPFFQSYEVPFELVRLGGKDPKKIVEAYIEPSLVIGMRGHAQMIPFGCKTPIISIISHNKMQWFLDDIGKPEWGVDVSSKKYKEELKVKALNSLKHTKQNIEFIETKQKELFEVSKMNVMDLLDKTNL